MLGLNKMLNLTSNHRNKFLSSQSRLFFYNLYIKEKLSTYKIGELLKITPQCIYAYLKRHNIKLRSFSECHKGRTSGFKGKTHTKEAKLKNKSAHLKEYHKERNDYYPNEFYNIRKEIIKRDNFKCQYCEISNEKHLEKYNCSINVHHIDYNKENCSKQNLITLCQSCNVITNGNRDYWFAYYNYVIEHYIKGEEKWLCKSTLM